MTKTLLFGGSGFFGPVILSKDKNIISVGRTKPPSYCKNKHIQINNLDFEGICEQEDITSLCEVDGNTTDKLNILEIGLGTNNPTLVSSMGSGGRPGASLYAFKQYLPNANIYGADIDKNILFNEERINTCYVDQLDIKTFDNIKNTFGNIKYDLIIDDGLHSIGANLNTLLFALNNIKINGWIIIEDIHIPDNWFSIKYILSKNKNINTYFIKAKNGYLFVLKRIC